VKAAEEAGRYASIVAMGIGDPQGTEVSMPDWMGRYRKVMDGEKPHISRLDEETLQKIAAMGNGIYTRAVPDTWDLDEIQKRLDALSSIASQSDLRFRYVNRYQWPLALALLCFAGEGLWLAALPWVRYWRMRREAPEAGRA